MYNLVSFQMYTCGGLMCDILNNKFSQINDTKEWKNGYMPGSVGNTEHATAKTGVNRDSTVLDIDFIKDSLQNCGFPDGTWVGTHCYPTEELIDLFDRTLCITTVTNRSRIYRWTRAYVHYVEPLFSHLESMDKLDILRGTAQDLYIIPFEPIDHPKVTNLEFSDLVEDTLTFKDTIKHFTQHDVSLHLDRWQKLNSFLYDPDLWQFESSKRYHEAEYEQNLNKSYRYH